MLRAAVLVSGLLLAAVGAILWAARGASAPGVQCLTLGLLVVIGVAFERWRYRNPDSRRPPGVGWQRTGERFVDPASGRTLEVYYDTVSGERRYVESGTED